MKNIYVDCTSTLVVEYTSGVQRVVKNILMRLDKSSRSDFRYIPILNIEGRNYAVNFERLGNARWTRKILSIATSARNTQNAILPEAESDEAGSKSRLYYVECRNSLRNFLIGIAQKIMFKLFEMAYLADGVITSHGQVDFGPEDVLFIPDSFWKKPVCNMISRASDERCKTIVLIHDIIAITHNNLFNSQFRDNFISRLNFISKHIDGIVTVSRYSMIEIMEYMKKNNPSIDYDYFYLGADFKEVPNDSASVNGNLKEAFAGNSVYLMVGTIEPRKNHSFVLDAFDKIWEDGMDICLCIVGREGWLCKEVMKRILSNPQYGRRLRYFRNIDDNGLAYCYRHAKAQIVASVVEGFGLPLVEAMHYCKPVFASDIPVFREVGGTYPKYFDLADPQSLSEAVRMFELEGLPVECQAKEWLSWDESVKTLLGKIEDMVEKLDARQASHV
jgi:O-antigen biosynthesis alpha-1,2-rhamnosyltransferase